MNDNNSMQSRFEEEYLKIERYASENGMIFKLIDDKLYVLTDIAYWKIVYLKEWNGFVLYHGNSIPTDLNILRYEDADYHFQKDAKQSETIMKYMVYIKRHDDFRADLIANVENMPRRTKKQKTKYEKMKKKEKAYNTARVLQLVNAVGMAREMNIAVSA